jgi:hypothetical protein
MAASKVKELLDELAATLAEMGMLEEQDSILNSTRSMSLLSFARRCFSIAE